MDKRWQNLGGIILAIFFVSHNLAKAENTTDPTDNVNLSPIQAWRSAYYCLQNVRTGREISPAFGQHFPTRAIFTPSIMSGWLNVTKSDGQSFCTGGCAAHTRDVLLCLEHVKKDFYFANKATIKDLNETINNGCNTLLGFTGVSLYESHGYRFSSTPVFASLSAAVVVLMTLFSSNLVQFSKCS